MVDDDPHVWIMLEDSDTGWAHVYGVFTSLERASAVLPLTPEPETTKVIRVPLDEFKSLGWWEG